MQLMLWMNGWASITVSQDLFYKIISSRMQHLLPPAPPLQLICAPLVWDQGLGAITLSRGCLAFASGIIAVWFGGFRENMFMFC